MIDIEQKRLDEAYVDVKEMWGELELLKGNAKCALAAARKASEAVYVGGDSDLDPVKKLADKADQAAAHYGEYAELVGPYLREWGELSRKQEWVNT